MFFYHDRVKAYISNRWDKNIINPDPQKKCTLRKGLLLQLKLSLCEVRTDHDINEWDMVAEKDTCIFRILISQIGFSRFKLDFRYSYQIFVFHIRF